MYKFYYSKKQEFEQGGVKLLVTKRGVARYTEVINEKNMPCLYEDAVLVFETDKLPSNIKCPEVDIFQDYDVHNRIRELDTLIDNAIDNKDKAGFFKFSKERIGLLLEL